MGPFLNDSTPSLHDPTQNFTMSFIGIEQVMAPFMLTTANSWPFKDEINFSQGQICLF